MINGTTQQTKRALCIGINYPGTDAQLAGCVNDAKDWGAELERRGYRIGLAIDAKATRDNLLGAMGELVDEARAGDRVVITYSGHGSWIPDQDGDEADGRDEVLCPVDFRSAGVIVDDELFDIFTRARRGVRLVFIADSCFSGTLRRFAPPIHTDLNSAPSGYSPRRARFLPPAAFLGPTMLDAARVVEHVKAPGSFRRSALTLSACRDDQTAYDAVVDGRPCGIFSNVALDELAKLPDGSTYRTWMRRIAGRLPSVDYPDVNPQIDGTSTQRGWSVLT